MELKNFLKSKGPLLALAIALVYGILVFVIYFTGYHAMPNNMNRLPVTIVNQDRQSKTLSNQLKTSLDKKFDHVHQTTSLSQAKKDLNSRKTYMIVDIPKDFSKNVKSNKHTTLEFYINESNQTSVVSGMKTVAKTVGASVQKNVIIEKSEASLSANAVKKLQQQLNQQKTQLQSQVQQTAASNPAAAKKLAAQGEAKLKTTAKQQQQKIQNQVQAQYAPVANGVSVKIHRTNKVKQGLNYSLAPFFANLGMYIASLLGAMLMYGTYAKFAKKIGRFKAFGYYQIALAIVALISTAIVKPVVMSIIGLPMDNFMTAWFGQFLVMMGAYELNTVCLLLMGQIGSSINIFLTMLQVVCCAGMVPLITMNSFFRAIHYFAPMYYGAQLDFNLFYGGVGTAGLFQGLAILVVGLLLVNTVIVYFRKKQPMLDLAKLS